MRTVAHRGLFTKQNTFEGVCELLEKTKEIDMIEIDVRHTTDRRVVLCHDRERCNMEQNISLDSFLKQVSTITGTKEVTFMLDIKAFGILEAQALARSVVSIVRKYSDTFSFYLCSFNEYCVFELLNAKKETALQKWQIGVISAGIPLGLFKHLQGIDFVSLDYNCVCKDMVDRLRTDRGGVQVYVWVVNDESMQNLMTHEYRVDGIIKDFF